MLTTAVDIIVCFASVHEFREDFEMHGLNWYLDVTHKIMDNAKHFYVLYLFQKEYRSPTLTIKETNAIHNM